MVERLRALCLRLPEAVEIVDQGVRPEVPAGKTRRSPSLGASMDRPDTLVFKPDPDEAPALREDARFFVPPYWGPSGWLAIDLDRSATDWTESPN